MCTSTGRICDGYQQTPDRRTRAFRESKNGSPRDRSLFEDPRPWSVVKGLQTDEIAGGADENGTVGFAITERSAPTAFVKTKAVTGLSRSYLTSSAHLLTDPHKAILSQRELSHFEFFIRYTSPQCSAFSGYDFWQRIVPQYTEAEPGLRHAVIAVGALHRNFEENQEPDSSFAIQQCNIAIHNLKHQLTGDQNHHVEVSIITCILFVSFAFFQGDARAACQLIHGGVKLMLEWEKISNSPEDSTIKLTLMKVFSRIQRHAMTCGNSDPFDEYNQQGTLNMMSSNQSLSQPIDSIEVASRLLFDIGWQVIQRKPWLSQPPHRDGHYDMVAILEKLQSWKAQCRISLMSRQELSLKDRAAWMILQLWSETIYILAATDWCADGRESRFDGMLPHFRKAVGYARELLNTEATRSLLPTFHMGPGIIPPLFFCINKCRDWELRNEAMSLLQSWHCQEGFYNSAATAKCSSRLIEIETEGLFPGETVPESRRIIATHVDYLPKRNTYRFWYRQVGMSSWKSTIVSA